jgi:MFS family permease
MRRLVAVFGGFLLLGGRLADFLGRRRMYMLGLSVFALASLAGALAQSALWLVIARGVQGLGAALVSPAALSLLMALFDEGAERNRALGVWAALGGSGGAAGAILGGALTDGLGWEAVLLVNLPIGALAMALAPRLLPEPRLALGRRAFDMAGALTVTAGLTLLVYSIVDANAAGWDSAQTIGLGALALLILAGFVAIEWRSRQPLVPLRIFRNRALRGGNLVTVLNTAALFPMFFFVTLYTQDVLGYTPIESGLAQLPIAVTIAASATVAPRLVARTGYRIPLAGGLTLVAAGLLWLAQIPAEGSYVRSAPPLDRRRHRRGRRVGGEHGRRDERGRRERGGTRVRTREHLAAARRRGRRGRARVGGDGAHDGPRRGGHTVPTGAHRGLLRGPDRRRRDRSRRRDRRGDAARAAPPRGAAGGAGPSAPRCRPAKDGIEAWARTEVVGIRSENTPESQPPARWQRFVAENATLLCHRGARATAGATPSMPVVHTSPSGARSSPPGRKS